MKGMLKWVMTNPTTGEISYDLGLEPIDTEKESIRDMITRLLVTDWETYGENGDSIIVEVEEE